MTFETAHKVFRSIIGAGLFAFVMYVVWTGIPFHFGMIIVPGFLVGVNTETAKAVYEALKKKS